MKKLNRNGVVLALACAGGLLAAGVVLAHGDAANKKTGRVPMPAMETPHDKQCVAPTEEMLRNHMKHILHQRDETMHRGIRTAKDSLKNCVNCHADEKTHSVLGKDGFCQSCHSYAAVQIDCFECHSSKREADAAAGAPGLTIQPTLKTAAGAK